jgi:hypothetical protein
MSDTITRRDVAHAAREYGQANGLPGFGSRGRVSKALVLSYVSALVRTIAADLGVTVTAKGKISDEDREALANAVALNAPKVEAGE